MITCTGLEKTYYGKGIETQVLKSVDLSVGKGDLSVYSVYPEAESHAVISLTAG